MTDRHPPTRTAAEPVRRRRLHRLIAAALAGHRPGQAPIAEPLSLARRHYAARLHRLAADLTTALAHRQTTTNPEDRLS